VGEIASLVGGSARVVELGSGSSNKTRVLLEHLRDLAVYVPVDISEAPLAESAEALSREFPTLTVAPLHTDYMRPFALPPSPRAFARTVAYFPGSTIGNLTPDEAIRFLSRIRALVGGDGALILGADLKKNPAVLHTAYNDPEGVTAAFNLNLLARINRELGADFPVDRFRHYAHYDAQQGRIVMQLVSLDRRTVRVDGVPISFEDGEPIVTEYSYKYSVSDFTRLAAASGFRVERTWCDEQRLFSVQYLVPVS
jgi:dimethylhistidine N-methyltransferase